MKLGIDDYKLTLDQVKSQIIQAQLHLKGLEAIKSMCLFEISQLPKDDKTSKV